MEYNAVEIGNRIKTLRKESNYTCEKFAERVGITDKFLYEIESGKKGFSAVTLFDISRTLQVSCEYIMMGEEIEKYQSQISLIFELFENDDINYLINILKEISKIRKK